MHRETPSQRAADVVADRGETRGHPGPIAIATAKVWSALIGAHVSPTDVAMMNAAQKMCRQQLGKRDADNLTDICGWTDVYQMVDDYMREEQIKYEPESPGATGCDGQVEGP